MAKSDYQAIRALNASGAHTIERQCPALYWHTSPFNPDRAEEEEANHFDIGEATHLLLLEPDKFEDAIAVIDAPNYTTKVAREARDRARNGGLTPLLEAA